jgi:hypothetical protein
LTHIFPNQVTVEIGKWFRLSDGTKIENMVTLSPCCGARINGQLVGRRYIDGYCRSCNKRSFRNDVYKNRFKLYRGADSV